MIMAVGTEGRRGPCYARQQRVVYCINKTPGSGTMTKLTQTACVLALVSTPVLAQQQPATSTSSRIAEAEQGLTSAVVLVGTPAPRRTIAAEMSRLHVPGVSVAVLHDGTIEWSKDTGSRAPGAHR